MNDYLPDAELVWQDEPISVEFSYENFDGNKSRRVVDVEQILVDKKKHLFYLYGYCHLRKEKRHFKHTNITTMLKVKSKRFYFEEWIEDELGLDMTQILNSDSYGDEIISVTYPNPPDLSKVDEYVRSSNKQAEELHSRINKNPVRSSSKNNPDSEMADLDDKSKYHVWYSVIIFAVSASLGFADGHIIGGLLIGVICWFIAIVLRALLKPKTEKNVWPAMRNLAVFSYVCLCLYSILT